MRSYQRLLIPVFATAVMFAVGCSPKMIPNTSIEDTPDNREIMALLEKYRSAVQERDVPTLMSLASPRYFDTRGTPGSSEDDYDVKGLEQFLNDRFKLLIAVQLDIVVDGINYEEDQEERELAKVEYRYLSRFQMNLPSGAKWSSNDERNRMTLIRENEGWRILSGM